MIFRMILHFKRHMAVVMCMIIGSIGYGPNVLADRYGTDSSRYGTDSSVMIAQVQDGDGKSRAAAQAKAQYGGKVLSVTKTVSDGQVKYKVKLLLDSGRVKVVTINE